MLNFWNWKSCELRWVSQSFSCVRSKITCQLVGFKLAGIIDPKSELELHGWQCKPQIWDLIFMVGSVDPKSETPIAWLAV